MNLERAFQILEVEMVASPEAVRQAYREMVKVWHPDRFLNDPKLQTKANAKLAEINRAFGIVSEFLRQRDHTNSSHNRSHRNVQAFCNIW